MLTDSKSYSSLFGRFSEVFYNFIGIGDEAAESLLKQRDKRGGQARLSAMELLCALTYHCIHGIGALSSNLKRATKVQMSDAGLFKTRQRVSIEMMNQISNHCLKVRSDLDNEPFSFYGDRLLVALDGTSFDLKNTEDLAKHFTKAKARRSKDVPAKEAAFARVNVSCLVELGLHNPLGLEVGSDEDSEVTLGNKLIDRIPVDCMFLADRLYGNACFVDKLLSHFKGSKGAFVIRVGDSTTSQEVIENLCDGSAIIRVPVRNRKRLPPALTVISPCARSVVSLKNVMVRWFSYASGPTCSTLMQIRPSNSRSCMPSVGSTNCILMS